MVIITAKVEMELDGFLNGWTDVTEDVRGDIVGHRGIRGTSPVARVAEVGIMTLAMNNAATNSGGLLGYYSPGHANCRVGFEKNMGVRFSVIIGATTCIQFTGRLEIINPTTGVYGERLSYLTVVDFMNETIKKRLSTLELETDITEAEAFAMILATIPLQPRATQIGDGTDTIPYVFDTVKDDRTTPMAEFVRLSNSTLALIFVQRDGTFVYEPRGVRATNFTSIITLTPADYLENEAPEIEDDRSTVVNRVTAAIHPRTLGTDPDVKLYEITAPFLVNPSANLLVRGYYTEEGLRVRRAGGLDMLPAVATTDYLFNTEIDGSGIDVTADVVVDTIFTANSVLFTINASVACYCTKLQARGTQVVDTANMSVEIEDAASIAAVGEVSLSLDMPYNADPVFGNEVVQYILFLAQSNQKRVKRQPLYLNGMEESRAVTIAQRAISDRVTITEPMNALSAAFFINGIDFEFTAERNYKLAWIPVIADATNYWFLGIVGYSELDFTTRLGFGLIIGHTDEAHQDEHYDTGHSDVAHGDEHGDVAHADGAHTDSAHTDVAHGDSAHTDTAHTNVAHGDGYGDEAHVDSHTNVAYNDNHEDVAHADVAHGDVAHADDAHTDDYTIQDPRTDWQSGDHIDHTDGSPPVPYSPGYQDHGDSSLHNDGAHNDTAHTDTAHTDGSHDDHHGDDAHGDNHNDTSHTNVHVDSPHTDVAHGDVLHVDSHGDAGHGDAAHADVTFVDTHTDETHVDIAHADGHDDVEHGDQN